MNGLIDVQATRTLSAALQTIENAAESEIGPNLYHALTHQGHYLCHARVTWGERRKNVIFTITLDGDLLTITESDSYTRARNQLPAEAGRPNNQYAYQKVAVQVRSVLFICQLDVTVIFDMIKRQLK